MQDSSIQAFHLGDAECDPGCQLPGRQRRVAGFFIVLFIGFIGVLCGRAPTLPSFYWCLLLVFIVGFHVAGCPDHDLSRCPAGVGEGVWRLLWRLQKLELPSQQVRLDRATEKAYFDAVYLPIS